jgi:hypothetical protein
MLARNGNAPATGRQQSAAGNSRAAVIDQGGRNESVSSPNAPVTGTLPPPPSPPPVRTVNPNAGAEEPVSTFSQRPLPAASSPPSSGPRTGDAIAREGSIDGPAPLRDPSPPPHPVPTRGSPWRWVGVAVFALLLVVAGIGMAMGLTTTGVVAYIWGTGDDASVRVDPPPPVPPVVPPPGPTPVKGSEVISPDSRTDRKTVPTVLSYSDKAGAEVDLRGPGGYHARWDGKAPFDLGKAGDGRYTATITAPNNMKFRLRTFTVEPGKASCKYSFDLTKGEWLGGCQ